MNPHTATLRMVANLVDLGMPTPLCVTLSKHGYRNTVQVDDEDLAAWLGALDLPAPTWHDPDADNGWERALWPIDAFGELPFDLVCYGSREAAEVQSGDRRRRQGGLRTSHTRKARLPTTTTNRIWS